MDNVEPKVVKSRTEKDEPNRVNWKRDNVDPILVNERIDIELENVAWSF